MSSLYDSMKTLGEKINILSPETVFLLQCPVRLTFDPKINREHLPSMGYNLYVWYGDSRW
jgi:hypothetical protein